MRKESVITDQGTDILRSIEGRGMPNFAVQATVTAAFGYGLHMKDKIHSGLIQM